VRTESVGALDDHEAFNFGPVPLERAKTMQARVEPRLIDEHTITRFEHRGHNVISNEEASRFLEELRTYTPPALGASASAGMASAAAAGGDAPKRTPIGPAAALHEAMYSEISSRKKMGARDPRHASPTPERLQRLVVCVLLRHHELISDAAAAGAALLGGGTLGEMPEQLRLQLSKLWEAAYKLGRWVHGRVVDADYAATRDLEALLPDAPRPAPFDRSKEEERICLPIERRALFLLRSLNPALPRDDEEEQAGQGGRSRSRTRRNHRPKSAPAEQQLAAEQQVAEMGKRRPRRRRKARHKTQGGNDMQFY
jgi:hypothetical protein